MSKRGLRLLWALLGLGLVVRLALAFTTYGVAFDVEAFILARDGLRDAPLTVYGDIERWPYPPGYFAWIAFSGWLAGPTGLDYTNLLQLPSIFADLAIAAMVQAVLGKRGAGERTRLAGAGLVALGPVFLMVSGYHGQIDSIAILPAFAGVVLWSYWDHPARAAGAGLLIGLGGVLKTVPIVLVLALLPWARSRREGALLLASAAAVPFFVILPFALADPGGVAHALDYRGAPGVGGISLAAQPNLARAWMNEVAVTPSGATFWLIDYGSAITGVAMVSVAVFLLRYRPRPIEGAALIYLALWAFGVNFFLQYLVWGLPFLLAAGYVREVAAAQVLIVPALVLVYLRPWESPAAAWVYAPASIGLWVASVAGFWLLARRVAGGSRARAPA